LPRCAGLAAPPEHGVPALEPRKPDREIAAQGVCARKVFDARITPIDASVTHSLPKDLQSTGLEQVDGKGMRLNQSLSRTRPSVEWPLRRR